MTEKKDLRPARLAAGRRRRRKRNTTVALGAGILLIAAVLMCVIVFFIVRSSVGFVKDFLGPDETPAYFNTFLEPVVMNDPKTFDNIFATDPKWQLETAIWASLDQNEKSGNYSTAPDGREILPIKDVAANMKKYFGSAVKPQYQTFSDRNFTYEYNKKEQCYFIPMTAVTDFYIPNVTKIANGFNTVTLTVQYIPGKNWGQGGNGGVTKPAPDKTMTIELSGSRGRYTVKAIKNYEQTDSDSKYISSPQSSMVQNSAGQNSAASSK